MLLIKTLIIVAAFLSLFSITMFNRSNKKRISQDLERAEKYEAFANLSALVAAILIMLTISISIILF